MSEVLKTNCVKCGAAIEIIPIAGIVTGLCGTCSQSQFQHTGEAKTCAHRRLEWKRRTDNFRIYRESDFYKLPAPEKTQEALAWEYGAQGLNLWGDPRMGKTRTLLMVLEMAWDAGKSFRIFGPKDFALELEKRHYNNAAYLMMLRTVDILAFDDIGKIRLTPVQEGEFFGVIENFIASGKPLFFTHNFSGVELSSKFRNGATIVARIREHCKSIHFGAGDS